MHTVDRRLGEGIERAQTGAGPSALAREHFGEGRNDGRAIENIEHVEPQQRSKAVSELVSEGQICTPHVIRPVGPPLAEKVGSDREEVQRIARILWHTEERSTTAGRVDVRHC